MKTLRPRVYLWEFLLPQIQCFNGYRAFSLSISFRINFGSLSFEESVHFIQTVKLIGIKLFIIFLHYILMSVRCLVMFLLSFVIQAICVFFSFLPALCGLRFTNFIDLLKGLYLSFIDYSYSFCFSISLSLALSFLCLLCVSFVLFLVSKVDQQNQKCDQQK